MSLTVDKPDVNIALGLKANSLTVSNTYNSLNTAIRLNSDKTVGSFALGLKVDSLTVSDNYTSLRTAVSLKSYKADALKAFYIYIFRKRRVPWLLP